MSKTPTPYLVLPGHKPGREVQYFATRADALSFAAANPERVSLAMFGTMSGTKEGRPYVALNVFTKAELRKELAAIATEDRARAMRQAERDRKIKDGEIKLPGEIVPTELGL